MTVELIASRSLIYPPVAQLHRNKTEIATKAAAATTTTATSGSHRRSPHSFTLPLSLRLALRVDNLKILQDRGDFLTARADQDSSNLRAFISTSLSKLSQGLRLVSLAPGKYLGLVINILATIVALVAHHCNCNGSGSVSRRP